MNLQNGFKSDEYFAINQLPHAWNQQEIDPFNWAQVSTSNIL